jgi:hypothetical protein
MEVCSKELLVKCIKPESFDWFSYPGVPVDSYKKGVVV